MEAGHTIDEALDGFPRVRLTRLPTPLEHLPQLSQQLGTQVFLKRDDLTDLALGGDKPRKLEYELAIAQEQKANVLVTCGSAQSNHARLTTAAARRLGMDCAVVLSRGDYFELQGNLLTVQLMGASIHAVDVEDHWELEEHASRVCDELRAAGQRPYFVPVSGTTVRSCLGYVRAGLEIVDQFSEIGSPPHAIYTPFGTGGIFTGVLMAARERGWECPVIGVSVNRHRSACQQNLEHWWRSLAELLGRDCCEPPHPYEIHDEFVGKGYGDPTSATLDAIRLLAKTEGILMDPVYSGKVLSGLVAHCRSGRWRQEDRILVLHSGGVPALFAYHESFTEG